MGGIPENICVKCLDWPFLSFIILLFFVIMFYKQISGLLNRGDIQISWGDKNIKLKELSENIDGEVDPIKEDVDSLKKSIQELQTKLLPQNNLTQNSSTPGSNQNSGQLTSKARELILSDMKETLKGSKYVWRKVSTLAVTNGITEDKALEILREDPEVKISIGKSGVIIAKSKNRII